MYVQPGMSDEPGVQRLYLELEVDLVKADRNGSAGNRHEDDVNYLRRCVAIRAYGCSRAAWSLSQSAPISMLWAHTYCFINPNKPSICNNKRRIGSVGRARVAQIPGQATNNNNVNGGQAANNNNANGGQTANNNNVNGGGGGGGNDEVVELVVIDDDDKDKDKDKEKEKEEKEEGEVHEDEDDEEEDYDDDEEEEQEQEQLQKKKKGKKGKKKKGGKKRGKKANMASKAW
jgi:hypothetical protein